MTNQSERLTARPVYGDDEVVMRVICAVRDVIEIENDVVITRSTSLIDLGADSLLFGELVFRLEEEFGITFPREYAVPDDRTIEDYVMTITHALCRKAMPGPR